MKFCTLKPCLIETLRHTDPKTKAEINKIIEIITNKLNKFENMATRFSSLTFEEYKDFVFYFYRVNKDEVTKAYCAREGLDYWSNMSYPLSNGETFGIICGANTDEDVLEDLKTMKEMYRADMEYLKKLEQNLDLGKSI